MLKDEKIREQAAECLLYQSPVYTASLFIVLCADLSAWKNHARKLWSSAPMSISCKVNKLMMNYYEVNPQYIRDDAMKSSGLVAQTLMLAAKEMGYDSTPIGNYNNDRMSELIKLPDEHVISMCIAIGKAKRNAPPKAGNMDLEEVLFYDSFTA